MNVTHSFLINGKPLDIYALNDSESARIVKRIYVSNRHTSIVDHRGRMLSTMVHSGNRSYGSRWTAFPALIRAAIALGVIPKDNIAALLRSEAREKAARERAYAAADILREYKIAGIDLTPRQIAKLKANARVKQARRKP